MEIRQLRCFVTCVEAGSFTAASELLYTTQSSVSKTIHAMEHELQTELFERTGRGIRLTARGQELYNYAVNVLDAMEQIEQLAGKSPVRSLKVAVNPSSWMEVTFTEFYERAYQKGDYYEYFEGNVRDIIERVQKGQDDLGFIYLLKEQSASAQFLMRKYQLQFEPLKRIQLMLYGGNKVGMGERGKAYFAGRGIRQETIEEFQLGYRYGGAGDAPRRRGRSDGDGCQAGRLARGAGRARTQVPR